MGQTEYTEFSEAVDDNKDVRISAIRSRKITITIASARFAGGKLSTILINMTLPDGGQDVRVKKVWIETTGY